MNGLMLKGFRVGKGKTQSDFGAMIEKSFDSYAKKERGEVEFTLDETAVIAIETGMSFEEFNAIFYDGSLPFRNIGQAQLP